MTTKRRKRLKRRVRLLEAKIAVLRVELAIKLDDPLVQHHIRKANATD